MKVRRGELGELFFRMVVEHHGGAKRQARYSANITTPKSIRWVLAILAGIAVFTAATRQLATAAVAAAGFVVMWIAPVLEANRLERAIRAATEDVALDLEAAAGTGS